MECEASVKVRVTLIVTRELAKYRRDLMGVQKVAVDNGGLEPEEVFFLFSMEKNIKIIIWRQDFCT